MSRHRVNANQQGPPPASRRAPAGPATLHGSILDLQRGAGNRAVAGLLQRAVGWSDASQQGRAWNAGERAVGKVRRIPLEGLSEGLSQNRKDEQARRRWVWADAARTKGHWEHETTRIPELSAESAKGRAIVLVPDALDATRPIEVLVFLHGFTEHSGRPYAGWRTLTDPAPKTGSDRLRRLRQGLDPADTAPVRDVALDQAEQQLEESGEKQLVIVLPQGGLHSQFDKEGGQDFDAAAYVRQVVSRLLAEKRWKDGSGQVVTSAPAVARVTMAGHSGAGAALSRMADRSAVTGDVVIYDAINGDQLSSFIRWVTKRLDEALAVLSDPSTGDQAKRDYLRGAQKLRGYTTDAYIGAYIALDRAITKWFARRGGRLGAFAGCLRANFTLEYVDVDHEELMRGSRAGQPRAAGTGTILDAIKGLRSSTAGCPAMPVPLEERYRAAKRKPARRKRAAVPA